MREETGDRQEDVDNPWSLETVEDRQGRPVDSLPASTNQQHRYYSIIYLLYVLYLYNLRPRTRKFVTFLLLFP